MKNILFLLHFCAISTFAYKPVILLHGILTGSDSMVLIKNRIEELKGDMFRQGIPISRNVACGIFLDLSRAFDCKDYDILFTKRDHYEIRNRKHPGTIVYNIDQFGGWSSLENMWYQVQQISQKIANITVTHQEGVNFLGYSQGALLGRTILQANPNHTVHRYISLSGPQAGQYGTQFLHLYFPGLALETAFELFYSRVGQHTSVGNYWNDPYHTKLYLNYSQYLPYVNNEISNSKSDEFKAALLKLDKFVLIGGPDDNVITPWQSSQFGYYDQNGTVVELKDRAIYQQDTIGLKTLYEKKKLKIITVPGINHFMWHLNMTICDNYILPYLD